MEIIKTVLCCQKHVRNLGEHVRIRLYYMNVFFFLDYQALQSNSEAGNSRALHEQSQGVRVFGLLFISLRHDRAHADLI